MDYSQSMANIMSIKEHIRLFKESSYIFFDFKDLTNFKIIFVEQADDLSELQSAKYQQDLPLAIIYTEDNGEEVLHYRDTVLRVDYNLTIESTSKFDIGLKILKEESRVSILDQYSSLVALLKKWLF